MPKFRVTVKYLDGLQTIGDTIGTKDVDFETIEDAENGKYKIGDEITSENDVIPGSAYNV